MSKLKTAASSPLRSRCSALSMCPAAWRACSTCDDSRNAAADVEEQRDATGALSSRGKSRIWRRRPASSTMKSSLSADRRETAALVPHDRGDRHESTADRNVVFGGWEEASCGARGRRAHEQQRGLRSLLRRVRHAAPIQGRAMS
jgi:hypothetical protein